MLPESCALGYRRGITFASNIVKSTGVSAALILFLVQYVLAYGVAFSRSIRLEPLPTILMFSIGLRSHKSGSRIGLAGALTVSAYFCLLAHFLPHH